MALLCPRIQVKGWIYDIKDRKKGLGFTIIRANKNNVILIRLHFLVVVVVRKWDHGIAGIGFGEHLRATNILADGCDRIHACLLGAVS